MFAVNAPAPFLSVVIRDCIKKGKDYYNGGPRYNTNYIQCCGIGTITDSLSAIKKHVYEDKTLDDGYAYSMHCGSILRGTKHSGCVF